MNAATSSGQSTYSAESKNHTIGAALTGTVGGVITRAYDMAEASRHTDNTLITAIDTVKIKSGNNTNLIGAQVAGDTVKMDVGGNLNIQTLQDATTYIDNVIGDVSQSPYRQAQQQEDQRAAAAGETPKVITVWTDGSTEKIILHGIAGAVQANISGAALWLAHQQVRSTKPCCR